MLAAMSRMDNESLRALLDQFTEGVKGRPGCWRVCFEGRKMVVVTDEARDRMRIMAPIVDDLALEPVDLQVLLAANFDRTLDARYAIKGGYLWSLYMHPLGDLTEKLLYDGLRQVKNLADNFGRSYGSSDLRFTGGS
jgi:hypothetical protein